VHGGKGPCLIQKCRQRLKQHMVALSEEPTASAGCDGPGEVCEGSAGCDGPGEVWSKGSDGRNWPTGCTRAKVIGPS